jgi:hypothetical protein
MSANLMLHCGAREVSREQLALVPCPPAEGRWRPVPHLTVLDYAEKALTDAGYGVEKVHLGLSRDDARFFGTLTLKSPLASGVSLAVGLRSSTDKSISLQWACGSRVFVCDNLAFRSEKVIARKHTTNGVLRYQEAICRAVAELPSYQEEESRRIAAMKNRLLPDENALAFLLRAYQDEGILSPRTLPIALKEWRTPSFEEFSDRTSWSLFNAVTFALGDRARTSPQMHAALTIKLGALLADEPQLQNPA